MDILCALYVQKNRILDVFIVFMVFSMVVHWVY